MFLICSVFSPPKSISSAPAAAADQESAQSTQDDAPHSMVSSSAAGHRPCQGRHAIERAKYTITQASDRILHDPQDNSGGFYTEYSGNIVDALD